MEGTHITVSGCQQCRELLTRVSELERVVKQLQKQNGVLAKQNAALQQQNNELSRRLEDAERASKRQTVRFPRRQRSADPKKPGRKGGHEAMRRAVPEHVDRTIDVPIGPLCPDCGHVLDITTHTQYQTDIPLVKPTVTQFNVQVGQCSCCGKRVQGRHAEQTSDALGTANHTLGPNAHAMAVSLKHGTGMSYAKISRFLFEWWSLKTAASTFIRAAGRTARKAQPTIRALREQLLRSEVINVDETGWRIGTLGNWLWVFANERITLFEIGRRGQEIPRNMLAGFDGVLGCDGYASYDPLNLVKLRCNGHILNRISRLKASWADDDVCGLLALEEIDRLFREAHALHRRHSQLTRRGYGRRVSEIENRFDEWLWLYEEDIHPDILRLRNHLADHREEWFLYLYNPALPTTNNLAERQIRPGVITRKLGGCNRTAAGALATQTLASLVATCRQQGRSLAAAIRQVLQARAPTAIHLATLPALG